MVLGFRSRGQVEKDDDGGRGRGRQRRRVVAIAQHRHPFERDRRLERTRQHRAQALDRLRVDVVAVGYREHLCGARAPGAEDALEIRRIDLQGKAPRKAPRPDPCGRGEDEPRDDDDDEDRSGIQMDPAGGILPLARGTQRLQHIGARNGDPGDQGARRKHDVQDARDVGGIEKRALPDGTVLERDAPQVEPADFAQRQCGGGDVQDGGCPTLPQRRGRPGPVDTERGGGVCERALLRGVMPGSRDGTEQLREQGPHALGRRPAHAAPGRRHRDREQDVDGDVPREQHEHRRRKQIDLLPRADVRGRDAGDERGHGRDDRDLRARESMARKRLQPRVARNETRQRESGAARQVRF